MQNEVFIFDSNIWISYLITRRLDKLVSVILQHHLTVLTSRQLIEEIQGVLLRPKFKKYIKRSDIKEFIAIHLKLCSFVETDVTANVLKDPKDNFLLDLYDVGKATILVSGDKEFLHEASQLNYQVMTLRELELTYPI